MYRVPDFWVMFLPWGNSGVQEPLTKFTMGNSALPRHFASTQWLWRAPCPRLPDREEFLGIARKRKPLSHCPTQGIFPCVLALRRAVGLGCWSSLDAGVGCCAECDHSSPQTSSLLFPMQPHRCSPPLFQGTAAISQVHRLMMMLLVTFMLLDLRLEGNYCYHPDRQCGKGWRKGREHRGQPAGTAELAPFTGE